LYGRKGEPGKAAEANMEALQVRQRLVQIDPNNANWQTLLANIEQNIAAFHLNQGHPAEAKVWLEKYLPIRERLARQDPANVHWQATLVSAQRQKEQIDAKLHQASGADDGK
jgi:hypothetical protein